MKPVYKKVLLITPSKILARGLEAVMSEIGEFRVEGILSDLSRSSEVRLKNMGADVVIVDPSIFDYASRADAKIRISGYLDAAVVALRTVYIDEEQMRQYDGVIDVYDDPASVVKKLRSALSSSQETPESEGYDLSLREKEILVCVAKGMINKEIADYCNLSIHTVITHRKNITRKTGIKTVAGLTVYALLNNLLDSNSIEL